MMKQGKDVNKNPSELIIRIGKKIGVDEFNRTVIQTKWIKAEKELNLGSLKNPNPEVIEFKYKQKQRPGFGIGFFGGED